MKRIKIEVLLFYGALAGLGALLLRFKGSDSANLSKFLLFKSQILDKSSAMLNTENKFSENKFSIGDSILDYIINNSFLFPTLSPALCAGERVGFYTMNRFMSVFYM